MALGLPEILRLATGKAQLHCHSTCESSPAVDSSRHGRDAQATKGNPPSMMADTVSLDKRNMIG